MAGHQFFQREFIKRRLIFNSPSSRHIHTQRKEDLPTLEQMGHNGLTNEDALDFVSLVKTKFRGQEEKYNTFLAIMREFKNERIDTATARDRVHELFKGERELILGFNKFLPTGYEISLHPDKMSLS